MYLTPFMGNLGRQKGAPESNSKSIQLHLTLENCQWIESPAFFTFPSGKIKGNDVESPI